MTVPKDAPKGVIYKGESFRLTPKGYYLSGRRGVSERLLHRRIWTDRRGPIPPGMVIHHKNGVTTDNHIANLELMENQSAHMRYHMATRVHDPAFRASSALGGERAREANAANGWHTSEAGREWHSKMRRAAWKRRKPVAQVCAFCGGDYTAYMRGRSRYCSRSCAGRGRYWELKEARPVASSPSPA